MRIRRSPKRSRTRRSASTSARSTFEPGRSFVLPAEPRAPRLRSGSFAVARGRAPATPVRRVGRVQAPPLERTEAPAGQATASEGRVSLGAGRTRQELPDGRLFLVRAARAQAPRALP